MTGRRRILQVYHVVLLFRDQDIAALFKRVAELCGVDTPPDSLVLLQLMYYYIFGYESARIILR